MTRTAMRPVTRETRAYFAPVDRVSGIPAVFESIEDFIARSSALVGSPQQVIDKVGRYHEQLGHEVIHLSADADGVTSGRPRRRADGVALPSDRVAV